MSEEQEGPPKDGSGSISENEEPSRRPVFQERIREYGAPREQRDVLKKQGRARLHQEHQGFLVKTIAFILTATILGAIGAFLFLPSRDLQTYGAIIIAPVVGLSGTVVGYYFGRKDRRN